MIDLIWRPPRKEPGVKMSRIDRKLPENFKYYRNWGFTIYRTYYNPESDKHWDMLLDALKRQTYLALGSYDDDDEYRNDVERRFGLNKRGSYQDYQDQDEILDDLKRLKKRFHLDPREDPSLLDGLDVRRLREVCLDEHPEAEKTMAGRLFRFVLVADEAVLKGIAKSEFFVKAVSYDWTEIWDYWGWMRIPTGYLLELWHSLMMSGFNLNGVLCFDGPEEDLEEYIWPGDSAANASGRCSEVEPWSYRFNAMRPLFKVERS